MVEARVEQLLGLDRSALEAIVASLRPLVWETPLLRSQRIEGVRFKAENLQRTHSFKLRAAVNALQRLDPATARHGIVTSSSGNFAQAVACAARALQLDATIVMMRSANPAKVAATRGWGARVVFCEDRFEARVATVADIRDREGRVEVFPYDHPDVIGGNATMAFEIGLRHRQVKNLLVPVSGGGLLAGSAIGMALMCPDVSIWGVQPKGSNAAALSFEAGKRVSIEAARTIADGITVTCPGELTFPIIRRRVNGILTVSEDSIREAIRLLLAEKLVVEPAGAVTVAALVEGSAPVDEVVCVLSGGNIDPELFQELTA